MKVFLENGHISEEGFKILTEDGNNNLNHLQVAKHLSYCDECLEKYLVKLDQMPPLYLNIDLTDKVFQKVRLKGLFLFSNKFTTVAVAACLTLVFWHNGVFQWQSNWEQRNQATKFEYKIEKISEETYNFTKGLLEGYSKILNNITELGGVFDGKK